MSADPEAEIRDLLNLEPATVDFGDCEATLRVGLTEGVCEDDVRLRRWIACRAAQLVERSQQPGRRVLGIEGTLDVMDALSIAFDEADEQCDFFELDRPERRQTDFGPLEAQVERVDEADRGGSEQGTLPGVEPEAAAPPELEPQRVAGERGEQTGLGGPAREETARATEAAKRRQRRQERAAEEERERSQQTLGGGQPARLSEFEGDDGGRGFTEEDVERAERMADMAEEAGDTRDCRSFRASIEQLLAASRGGTIEIDDLRDRLQDAVDAGCITEDQANRILELTPADDTPPGEPLVSSVTEATADMLFERVKRAFGGSGNR